MGRWDLLLTDARIATMRAGDLGTNQLIEGLRFAARTSEARPGSFLGQGFLEAPSAPSGALLPQGSSAEDSLRGGAASNTGGELRLPHTVTPIGSPKGPYAVPNALSRP